MVIALFKITAVFMLVVFVFFISDWRKKKGMVPLLSDKITKTIKIFYIVPILIYLYILIRMDFLRIYDFIGLVLNLIGSFLVVKAKIDLGKYHTWAGYRMKKAKLVTKGIYSYMRHPLYTGIVLFILGAGLIIIGHGSATLIAIAFIFLLVIIPFIIYSASKESEMLEKEFGREYLEYKGRVGPFCPIIRT